MFLLRMPRLGQTMEAGTIVRWAKPLGSSFEVGEDLYDVATEKVEVAVEAKAAGTLLRIVTDEGVEVEVGAVLAVVGDPGEEPDPAAIERLLSEAGVATATAGSPARAGTAGSPAGAGTAGSPARAGTAGSPAGAGTAGSPARAATAASLARASVGPAGGAGAAGMPPARLRVIPRARALAGVHGVDLATVPGTGRNGAITVADVEAAIAGAPEPGAAGFAQDLEPAVLERHRLTGVHRAMAEGVARSWPEIPQFTQTVLVDCSALRARRSAEAAGWEAAYGVRPSVNHYLVQAVVSACRYVPDANARLEADEVVTFADVNPTVAVAAPSGLLTPVLRRAHLMDLGTMALAMGELVERARRGALTLDDFAGGTITISNLGMFGVDTGTPLVNAGQAVIVFAGAVKDRPLAVDGRLEVRPTMYLTISADHRVLDGLTGAQFLTAVRDELEHGG